MKSPTQMMNWSFSDNVHKGAPHTGRQERERFNLHLILKWMASSNDMYVDKVSQPQNEKIFAKMYLK